MLVPGVVATARGSELVLCAGSDPETIDCGPGKVIDVQLAQAGRIDKLKQSQCNPADVHVASSWCHRRQDFLRFVSLRNPHAIKPKMSFFPF